jgi:hypothetical protein
MEAIRALIYAVAVFAGLAVIALIVAGLMRLMYTMVHRSEKKDKPENNADANVASQ